MAILRTLGDRASGGYTPARCLGNCSTKTAALCAAAKATGVPAIALRRNCERLGKPEHRRRSSRFRPFLPVTEMQTENRALCVLPQRTSSDASAGDVVSHTCPECLANLSAYGGTQLIGEVNSMRTNEAVHRPLSPGGDFQCSGRACHARRSLAPVCSHKQSSLSRARFSCSARDRSLALAGLAPAEFSTVIWRIFRPAQAQMRTIWGVFVPGPV
jgi:hypothetical protein